MSWWYKQITSERDLSNTNFANGVIKYKYHMNANQQINLDKSFIRLRVKLSKGDGATQLDFADGVAPNYLMAYNLFKQMYHEINGIQVGECRSYCSQVGALRHRILYPQSYKDKFLATSNYAKIDIDDRINDVVSLGLEKERLHWRKSKQALPAAAGVGILPEWILYLGVNRNQIQFVNATSDIVFSALLPAVNGTVPDLSTIYDVGDIVYFFDGVEKATPIVSFETTVTTNDTLRLGIAVTNVAVADIVNQFRHNGYDTIDLSKSKRTQEFEIVFKPPMGVWHKSRWMPAHDMSLNLYPHPDGSWQKNSIESLASQINKAHNTDFTLEIQDMIMYVAVLDEKHPDGKFSCEYDDMRCQLTNITTTSNVDYHFVVDRDAYAFTVALQDENCENDTRRSCTKFKIREDQELKLQRYYIDYNGRILPNPYPNISKTSSKDFLTQRYYESIFYSEANANYDVESLDDWRNAGMYFTHQFGKSRTQTEKVTVSTLFEDGAFGSVAGGDLHRPNLLLFDHFKRNFSMMVSGGKVREITADIVN